MPSVIDTNNCIPNGLPASVMRQSMENKNLLSGKGAMYVGLGTNNSVTVDGQTYVVSRTSTVVPNGANDDGKILVCNHSSALGWDIVDTSTIDAHSATYATNVNLSGCVSQVIDGIGVNVSAGSGTNASVVVPKANMSDFGVVKIVDSLGCTATDTVVSANIIDLFNGAQYIKSNESVYSIALGYNTSMYTLGGSTSAAIAIGNNASASSYKAIAIGNNSKTSGTDSICIGNNAACNESHGIVIGNNSSSSGSIVIGDNAHNFDYGRYGVIIGSNAICNQSGGIAIGNKSSVLRPLGIAIGDNAICYGDNCDGQISIGNYASCSGHRSVALGYMANASNNNEIVLGSTDITALRCQVQTISALSDSRVKEEITLANTSTCLADVNRLPVSRFKYKDFTGKHLDVHRTGFMADDVEVVFPKDIILRDETFPVLDSNGNEVFDEVTNPDGTIEYKRREFVMKDVKSISMAMGLPTLWGAVQELSKKIDALEQENQQLRERINSL